jgi:hypothetical protein
MARRLWLQHGGDLAALAIILIVCTAVRVFGRMTRSWDLESRVDQAAVAVAVAAGE